MSETDSFIQEVTEEIRQDRMYRLWKRYAPFVIGAIVLIVGAAAVWNWLEHRAVLEARETGGAFLAAEINSPEAQEALLEAVDDEARAVAELRRAGALAQAGERDEAAKAYRAVAASDALAADYRDLALLSAIRLEAAEGDPAELIATLAPLAEEGAPYRPLALELRGVLQLNAGDVDAARDDLQAALTAPSATSETRQRVNQLLAGLGPAPASD